MIPSHVALISLTDKIRIEELAWVAGALQIQVIRDFFPVWQASAVIVASTLEAIPAGFTPIIVHDTLEADGVDGFHRTRSDDTSYVLVPFGTNWSLAASHELLRMMVNPTGSLRYPGTSRLAGQGTVEYLTDVCAPCQHVNSAYSIDGVAVSDFCTPNFFGAGGSAYSFNGAARDALEPAPGGVLTWLADDGLLYQARADLRGAISLHGGFSTANRDRLLLREFVDLLIPDRLVVLANAPLPTRLQDAGPNARRAQFTNMIRFREDIAWRFGHAPEIAPVHRRDVVRKKSYVMGAVRSGQHAASLEPETTFRTAS